MKNPLKNRFIHFIFFVSLLLPFLACSPKWHREDADREVYKIIEEKQKAVLGETTPFSIDEGVDVEVEEEARENYLPNDEESGDNGQQADTIIGEGEEAGDEISEAPKEPVKVNLEKALILAFQNNRDYKSQKENLYTDALNLTYQRYLWTPRFGGALSGDWTRDGEDNRYGSASADFSVSQVLATGGELGLGFATDLFRYFTGDPSKSASSLITLSFLQPLWRDAGSLVARENLTQAERNVAYEIRSFHQYRKSFAVDVISSYYGLLQQKDRVENQENSYKRLKLNRERSELMGKAGRIAEFQVDQARQDELDAENSLVNVRQSFDAQLDSFKILLGLPMDTVLEPDYEDLQRLRERGLVEANIDLEAAIRAALTERLDLMTVKDQIADNRRRVVIAENGLGPDLNFDFSYSVGTQDPTKFMKFQFNKATYNAGLRLDLPIERTSERNSYRQALISLERARRSYSLQKDRIMQNVRQSYRSLNQAKESYEISKISLALAEKRVESTDILMQAGRAETRDLLDANSSLLSAQNNLTNAIVNHTIAVYDFLVDVEALEVDEQGLIQPFQKEDFDWIISEGAEDE